MESLFATEKVTCYAYLPITVIRGHVTYTSYTCYKNLFLLIMSIPSTQNKLTSTCSMKELYSFVKVSVSRIVQNNEISVTGQKIENIEVLNLSGNHIVTTKYGEKIYIENGLIHRDGGFPAVIFRDGNVAFYTNGVINKRKIDPTVAEYTKKQKDSALSKAMFDICNNYQKIH
jgi:hypothetical protein